jgi:hypothetical protein
MTGPWSVALLVTTAAHAGFQAVVTLQVYPALARVPAVAWPSAHAFHSRRITPVVVVVYGALLVACTGAVLAAPGSVGVWVAALGATATFLVTAAGAAPIHGRLGGRRTELLLSRLLVVDRLRLGFSLVALGGAVAASW